MPELPEIEIIKRGLNEIFGGHKHSITNIEVGPQYLRGKPASNKIKKAHNQRLHQVIRKAKYLLMELDDDYLLSHLGMSGSWRLENIKKPQKHDHVHILLSDGRTLVYKDPRRFGQFDIIAKSALNQDKRLVNLGPDPLDKDSLFTMDYLYTKAQLKKKITIKSLLMDQRIVAGLGNIYVNEALYQGHVKPQRLAKNLKKKECQKLVLSIHTVLLDAIACGGSTIRDFRQAGGYEGYFQNRLHVYGRDQQRCPACKTSIQKQVIAGRSSFWCPNCQL